MQHIILAVVLFATSSAQAALVTFDDFPSTPHEVFPNYLVSTPQGFDFAILGAMPGDAAHIYTLDGTLRLIGQEQNPELRVTQEDGSLFNLSSLDLFVTQYPDGRPPAAYGPYRISALDASDQLLAELEIYGAESGAWQTILFDDSWHGINSLVITPSQTEIVFGTTLTGDMTLDNFAMTAVPIPAAVWMFASGLGLLGWLKRKQA